MELNWVREDQPARWDVHKKRVVGGSPVGAFDSRLVDSELGAVMPGAWYRVEHQGAVVGYGWLDVNWGDAEILLATAPDRQGAGIGTFILEHLSLEARKRGLNYLTNVVRETNPRADEVRAWLCKRGFSSSEDGRLLRASSDV